MNRVSSGERRRRVPPLAAERLEPRTVCAVAISVANDTGMSRSDRITSDPTLVLDRQLSAGQRLHYRVDGGPVQTASLVGGRSFVPQGIETDGRHVIKARIVNAQGRAERWSRPCVVTLDRGVAAPTVSLVADTGRSSSDGVSSSSAISVTGVEAGGVVQYSRDDGDWNPSTALWGTYEPQSGPNRWFVRQVDPAGNASTPVAISFEWDAVRDTATRLEGPQSASFTAVAGQEVAWVLEFAGPMYVEALNGTLPHVQFSFRGTMLLARYREGSGTNRLTYSRIFTADEAGTGELFAPVTACLCFGGSVADTAGNRLPKHGLPAVNPASPPA
jgi:hypothetical protein